MCILLFIRLTTIYLALNQKINLEILLKDFLCSYLNSIPVGPAKDDSNGIDSAKTEDLNELSNIFHKNNFISINWSFPLLILTSERY